MKGKLIDSRDKQSQFLLNSLLCVYMIISNSKIT